MAVQSHSNLPVGSSVFASQPASDSGRVKGDLVKRWDGALHQVRSHRRGCTCDPCMTARGFLDRMAQLIAEVWPND